MGFPSFIYRQLFVHLPQILSNISLKEQAILLTGANSGIVLEAARQWVRLGAALVIFAVRSLPKGKAAKADVLKTNPGSKTKVELWQLDMESYNSVLAFGKHAQELPRLDIAMLNAACFKYEFEASPSTGNESSMQVNHLSTALLSLLLLPVLKKTSQALTRPTRLTITSSEVHMSTPSKSKKQIKS
jgi:retinol dehydrogenase-12